MSDLDAEERELLRSTARATFTGDADLPSLGELGFLGLVTPEDAGGSGWNVAEAAVIAIEAGRALTPVAWSGNLLAAAALAASPAHAEQAEALAAGRLRGAFLERPVTVAGGSVTADLELPGTDAPDVLVVISAGTAYALDLGGAPSAVRVEPVDVSRGSQRITLVSVAATELPDADAAKLSDLAVLLAAADSLGALAATATRVTSYLVEREAFGHPLASFQVLQHRLVDLDILVAETAALVDDAAEALHVGTADARALVGMLQAFLSRRVVDALDDAIQLSGGIGLTAEWPVHEALRRAVVNSAVRRPATLTAEALQLLLGDLQTPRTGSDPYRDRIRAVIDANDPPRPREGHRAPVTKEQEDELRAWYRVAFAEQIAGASWPVEWGGDPDFEPARQLVITEELIRTGAPRPIDQVNLSSHVLLGFGTAEQKERYLPRIRAVDDVWCQLFSEPGAGSDLAGVTTRAEQRPDGSWVLAGQKTWTTDGHWAQYGLAIVRTSQEARRHEGLSVFIVPMDAPGLEIHPIPMINGAHDVNTVFLDGVVLPPENLVGEVGQGWAIAMSGLELERYNVGGNVVLLELLLASVIAAATGLRTADGRVIDDPLVRAEIQDQVARFAAIRAFVTGHIDRVLAGTDGVGEGSIAKIVYTEAYNAIARFGVGLVETYGPPPADVAEAAQHLQDSWLWSRALTVSGGSSEVNRNILAKRRLRLPSA